MLLYYFLLSHKLRVTRTNYSFADWKDFVFILEMLHGKIPLNVVLLLLRWNFFSCSRLEIMYIFL